MSGFSVPPEQPKIVYSGTDALKKANNLIDVADTSTSRLNLGLNTAATHPATDFDNTGAATAAQAAAIAVSAQRASNLSDLSNATTARTNLGLGTSATHPTTDYQPVDAELTALAGLTSAADALPYFTGSGTAAITSLSTFVRTLLGAADAAALASLTGAQVSLPAIGGVGESLDRRSVTSSGAALATGRVTCILTWLPAVTLASLSAWCGSAASLTHSWFGVWSSAGSLLGTTVDDTSAWSANTIRTNAFSGGLVIPSAGWYYLGVMVASTSPNVWGSTNGAANGPQRQSPVLACQDTHAGLTTPAGAPSTLVFTSAPASFPYIWAQ